MSRRYYIKFILILLFFTLLLGAAWYFYHQRTIYREKTTTTFYIDSSNECLWHDGKVDITTAVGRIRPVKEVVVAKKDVAAYTKQAEQQRPCAYTNKRDAE